MIHEQSSHKNDLFYKRVCERKIVTHRTIVKSRVKTELLYALMETGCHRKGS